jgi:hypothetical protein
LGPALIVGHPLISTGIGAGDPVGDVGELRQEPGPGMDLQQHLGQIDPGQHR